MAGWYRRELADDARLLLLLDLGHVELAKAHLRVTEHRVARETDELPEALEAAKAQLEAMNLWRTLEAMLGPLIAQRARTNRSRRKVAQAGDITSRVDTSCNVTTRDVTARRDETREEEKRETLSPRKRPAVRIPDAWAPTAAHRAAAESRGLAVEWQAERFRDHAQAHDRRCADWDAAFRNWLAKADPTRQPVTAARTQRPTLEAVGIPRFAPKALP
jgi:hypothetical protein